jgi:hypothetical protein
MLYREAADVYYKNFFLLFFLLGSAAQRGPGPPLFYGFWITYKDAATVGRTSLDG